MLPLLLALTGCLLAQRCLALPINYTATVFASGLHYPRGLALDTAGNLLVTEQYLGAVTKYWTDGSGASVVLLTQLETPIHGIVANGNYLYVSSDTTVRRWPYVAESQLPLSGGGEVVVAGLPAGGHNTRTLIFDAAANLYVSVGSYGNLDSDSHRARVMRYTPAQVETPGGVVWLDGEVFADGLRNEVGLAFDADGRLWGVENGVDSLARDDLGGDIHRDNPGEEVNLLGTGNSSTFYGYPSCWSQGPDAVFAGALEPGTQWYDSEASVVRTDEWCRTPANVVAPKFVLPAHIAPLGCAFSNDDRFGFVGDLFVASHGSWNREPPRGYCVYRITYARGLPVSSEVFFGTETPAGMRPVNIVFLGNRAFVSSDADGRIYVITHSFTTTTTTTAPTTTTTTATSTSTTSPTTTTTTRTTTTTTRTTTTTAAATTTSTAPAVTTGAPSTTTPSPPTAAATTTTATTAAATTTPPPTPSVAYIAGVVLGVLAIASIATFVGVSIYRSRYHTIAESRPAHASADQEEAANDTHDFL